MLPSFRSLAKRGAYRLLVEVSTRQKGDRPGFRILNYHELVPGAGRVKNPYNQVSESRLRRHLALLRDRGFQVVTVEELLPGLSMPEARGDLIALTFDDGLQEHATIALPALRDFRARATFYVLPSCIGEPTRALSYPGFHLDAAGLRTLRDAGMEVGSHGWSHRVLLGMPAPELHREVAASREELRRLLGHDPRGFAYPYGSKRTFNGAAKDAIRNAGYAYAVSMRIGVNSASTDRYELRRLPVYGHDDDRMFLAKARGGYDWVGAFQEAWLRAFPHHSTRWIPK